MPVSTPPSTPITTPILDRKRYMDDYTADKVVRFFSKLKHTKGDFTGRPFRLQPWQEKEIIRPLFGTVWEDGTRCFNTAYMSTGKKNGKTELGAPIALYMLTSDGEMGAEVYSAAGDKNQASRVFDAASAMVESNRSLKKRLRIIKSQRRIVYPATGSFYQVVAADADLREGVNPSCVLYDELHVAKNRKLWDTFTTGMISRRQPLLMALTTAGYDRNSICWEQYKIAKDIIDKKIYNPTFFSFIREAPTADDWSKPETWAKANPNLGISIPLVNIEKEFLKAKQSKAYENSFRRFILNQWTENETAWITWDQWIASAGSVNAKDFMTRLKGRKCWAGLDLSSTTDITALVMVFPNEDGSFEILPIFWIPKDNMLERSIKNRLPYNVWHQEGFLEATEGNVLDLGFVFNKILELSEYFDIQDIAFDPWNAIDITQKLEKAGVKIVQFQQRMSWLSAPTKEFERLVLQKKLHHGRHPILDWMIGNVSITRDSNDNYRPNKEKSRNKIDGIVAGIMGLDRAIRRTPGGGESLYKKRGIITF